MNTLDYLQDLLQDEMMMESMYNKHMMDIMNPPEVRQLLTQMRDAKNGPRNPAARRDSKTNANQPVSIWYDILPKY